MCVHWLTGDGLRREDGLRASERPEVLLQRIARSCVCAVVVCAHFCLIDRERSRCVWLSPRAPRPRPRAARDISVGRRVPESRVCRRCRVCAHPHASWRDWDCREDVGGSQRRRVLPPVRHTDVAHARRQHDRVVTISLLLLLRLWEWCCTSPSVKSRVEAVGLPVGEAGDAGQVALRRRHLPRREADGGAVEVARLGSGDHVPRDEGVEVLLDSLPRRCGLCSLVVLGQRQPGGSGDLAFAGADLGGERGEEADAVRVVPPEGGAVLVAEREQRLEAGPHARLLEHLSLHRHVQLLGQIHEPSRQLPAALGSRRRRSPLLHDQHLVPLVDAHAADANHVRGKVGHRTRLVLRQPRQKHRALADRVVKPEAVRRRERQDSTLRERNSHPDALAVGVADGSHHIVKLCRKGCQLDGVRQRHSGSVEPRFRPGQPIRGLAPAAQPLRHQSGRPREDLLRNEAKPRRVHA
mmetsp:Transcript_44925/g.147378  ORF Transcript_44925/g.147378 Transcript_44925/m.147378 type:complete len:467 (+) Transcript_44925:625-2025(+)